MAPKKNRPLAWAPEAGRYSTYGTSNSFLPSSDSKAWARSRDSVLASSPACELSTRSEPMIALTLGLSKLWAAFRSRVWRCSTL